LLIVLLLCVIYFSGSLFLTTLPFVLLQMTALLVIFWAVLVKYLHKKTTLRGAHKNGGVYLIHEGPYEFIRHPIYTGLLLFAFSYVQESLVFGGAVCFMLFVILLVWRVGYDERLALAHFKHTYSEYKKTTKMLVPYVY